MIKAEEAALKAYPDVQFPFTPLDLNAYRREAFINGYETAEKDLALTWGDVQLIDHFVLELVGEEKEGKDWGDGKEFYTEVLTRFKKFKEESND